MSEAGYHQPKQWFVVHTYSGFENKVAPAIESRAKIFGLQDMIGRVVVPTEKVREIRKSKKIETEQKFFPGYLLVEMELTDDTWHLVRSTPKVTGFVGSGNKPVRAARRKRSRASCGRWRRARRSPSSSPPSRRGTRCG